MSTYLQLCAKLRQETVDSGSGPSTVIGNSGELARMVAWVADAWTELQTDNELWLWMHKYFTVNTVASTGEYAYTSCTDTVSLAAISRFSRWHRNEFRCYLSSAGVASQYRLIWMDWEDFREIYRFGTQTTGQPVFVSIDPTMKFALGPKPDAVYVVTGGYQIGPQILAANADEPELPSKYHNLIVYEAMSKYGGSRVAPEAILRANAEGGKLRAALELEQLPRLRMWNPMV